MCWSSLCVYCPAAGSGIPEVKAYLNGVDAHSMHPLCKGVFFGSIFGVAAGFVVGKEGPMVHMGACIANLLGQGASTKYHLTWTWLRYFKNDRDSRDLITCGAAAGVAAAFRSPVGGSSLHLKKQPHGPSHSLSHSRLINELDGKMNIHFSCRVNIIRLITI
ncbi:putative chloride channel, voltage gated, chloride channel, core [Helianthus debilis subsp. tardiflorus]